MTVSSLQQLLLGGLARTALRRALPGSRTRPRHGPAGVAASGRGQSGPQPMAAASGDVTLRAACHWLARQTPPPTAGSALTARPRPGTGPGSCPGPGQRGAREGLRPLPSNREQAVRACADGTASAGRPAAPRLFRDRRRGHRPAEICSFR